MNNEILVFGEVLFDDFGRDNVVLGGAPFNVAWHLQGFGIQPFFVSRIGNDKNGKIVVQRMKDWGLSVEGMQKDDMYPTGIVSVTTKNGEPEFNIRSEQAYDFINFIELNKRILNKSFSIIYNGTLALRNEPSLETLKMIRMKTGSKVFLDINLRDPWWKHDIIVQEMTEANWVKCNSNELKLIARSFNMNQDNVHKLAINLCTQLNLEFLIVTLGEKGALIIDKERQENTMAPVPVTNLTDTVGAGDAFSAVSILGVLKKWDIQTILKRAIDFSAKMCQVKGATLNDKKYYELLLKEWNN